LLVVIILATDAGAALPSCGDNAVMVSPLPSDAELVQLLCDRDEGAFRLVVGAWSPGMLRLARSFVSTDETAREVLQDTWIAVLAGVDGFQGRSSLRTWTCRILVNTAKRRASRESRTVPWSSWALERGERDAATVDPSRFQGPGEAFPGHWREFPREWPSPESAAMAAEVRTTLTTALLALPARQRIVITLRDVEGYSAEEVCVILTISAANQRVLLHRARASVRERLEAFFAPEDASDRSTQEVAR
jgi:RNA polymerase sigma-70 factor (ECF subfamily)